MSTAKLILGYEATDFKEIPEDIKETYELRSGGAASALFGVVRQTAVEGCYTLLDTADNVTSYNEIKELIEKVSPHLTTPGLMPKTYVLCAKE